MVDPNRWIGGQLTSQMVPPDEHPWIEEFGCTARYRTYRELVRDYYRSYYPLQSNLLEEKALNPGRGWVSRLCHEPRVGVAVLYQMLAYPIATGLLSIETEMDVEEIQSGVERVQAVSLRSLRTGATTVLEPQFVLDATELGDGLKLAGCEYVVGAECRTQTGEQHALDGEAQPNNQQGFTWCFAMAYDPHEDRRIEMPKTYDFWKSYMPSFWPNELLSWTVTDPISHQSRQWSLFPQSAGGFGLFDYRRIVSSETIAALIPMHEVTVVNWPQNDYWLGALIDVEKSKAEEHLDQAKELSRSLLYWLQTEAGYPGLYLSPQHAGTPDGFAQAPYIRESRRIVARTTILEQHVSANAFPGMDRTPKIEDSIGIGCYRIDLHPTTSGDSYLDLSTLPFEIPLGAIIPVRMRNLLPACKNIGTTHITNGCCRLHPIEWNIGEAAGSLAAMCILMDIEPNEVFETASVREDFQSLLVKQGVELRWPTDVSLGAV